MLFSRTQLKEQQKNQFAMYLYIILTHEDQHQEADITHYKHCTNKVKYT